MLDWFFRLFRSPEVVEQAEGLLDSLYGELWEAVDRVAAANPCYIIEDEENEGESIAICALCMHEIANDFSDEHDDDCGFRLCFELAADLPAGVEEEDDA